MSKLKQHPKYKHLYLNENGEVWSSYTGNGRLTDKPCRKLTGSLKKNRGFLIITAPSGVDGPPYYKIHRLMAEIFLDGKPVLHKDGDRTNNKLSNLGIYNGIQAAS